MKAFWKDPVALTFAVCGLLVVWVLFSTGGHSITFAQWFAGAPHTAFIGLLAATAGHVMMPLAYGASFLLDSFALRNENAEMIIVLVGGPASYFILGKIVSIILRWLTKDKNTLRYRLLNDPDRTGVLFLLFEGAIPVAYAHIMYTLILDKAVMIACLAILQTAAFFMLGAFVLALVRGGNREELNDQQPLRHRHPRESGDPVPRKD